jgi:hypothetical protein
MTPERLEKLAAAIAEERERRREERRLADDYNPHFIWIGNGEDADAVYRAAMADPELKGFDIELFGWAAWDVAEEAEWNAKWEQIQQRRAKPAAVLPAKPSEADTEEASLVRESSDKAVNDKPPAPAPAQLVTEIRWRPMSRHWLSE